MLLHELIDRDYPKCLYCQGGMNVKVEGDDWSFNVFEVVILTCRVCNEVFEIHSTGQSDTGDLRDADCTSFLFSCVDICARVVYSENICYLNDHNLKWPTGLTSSGLQTVPMFDIDFSDKQKLYTKLRTYLIFS